MSKRDYNERYKIKHKKYEDVREETMAINQEMIWDQYILDETLFYGRETTIWRAHTTTNPISVILKISTIPTKQNIARLKREYRLLSSLDIDNVIRALGEVHAEGKYGLVLEDKKQTMMERLIQNKPMDLDVFFPIAIHLASAINALHDGGIIHKDIKPNNILVDVETGKVTLIDLSIAAEMSREFHLSTAPEQLEGTLAYMAPEQTGRVNRNVDQRADLYSLGITFYQMLTGKLPFVTDDPSAMIYAHMTKMPTPPHLVNRHIPEILSDIVMTLLKKDVSERYQTAHILEKDLSHCYSEWQKLRSIPKFPIKQNDIPAQLVISEKIYGREKILADLMAIYERISHKGLEFAVLTGEAGIGKTALIEQLRYELIQKNCIFIEGKFEQFKRDVPFAALSKALNEFVEELMTRENEKSYKAWCVKIKETLGFNAKIITDLVHNLTKMIGEPEPVPELDPEKSFKRLMFVLHDFINLIATKEHPLIIFLDDLQSADTATLRWLKEMAAPNFLDTNHLMIIGAYRDNDLSDQALITTLDAIKEYRPLHSFKIHTLELEDVTALIADTLYTTQEKVVPLATLLLQKTAGNPYYLVILLSDLYRNHGIKFDYHHGEWVWQLAKIEKQNITANVIEFLSGYLQMLSKDSQDVLKVAACIGTDFSLKQLASIQKKEANEIAKLLWPAIEKKLIVPLSNNYRIVESQITSEDTSDFGVSYRFAHDRVQQTAYQLLTDEQRERLHYKIGKIIWAQSDEATRIENIIDIANHYNIGIKYVSSTEEILLVANINYQAAERAKTSANCVEALQFITTARNLLPPQPWEQQYTLAFNLSKLYAECTYATGEYVKSNEEIINLLKHAQNTTDKVSVYCLRIQLFLVQAKFNEAVTAMSEGLAELKFNAPKNPSYIHIAIEFAKFIWCYRKRSLAGYIDQPLVEDPRTEGVAKLISLGGGAAYEMGDKKMVVLMCLKSLIYAAKHPISRFSAFLFSTGVIFFLQLNRYQYSHEFATLAYGLAKRYPEPFTFVQLSYAILYCSYWLEPEFTITKYGELFQECWHASQQTGDSYFAMVCSDMVRYSPCDAVLTYMEKNLPALKLLNVPSMYDRNARVYARALNEALHTSTPISLNFSEFNEEKSEAAWKKENNYIQLYEFYIDKIEIYAREEEFNKISKILPDYFSAKKLFRNSDPRPALLALAKTVSHANAADKTMINRHLKKQYKFLCQLAKYNPDFTPWITLLDAEFARQENKFNIAAIHYAKAHEQFEVKFQTDKLKILDYAEFLERIGAFYLQHFNKTVAIVYLLKANALYTHYGYHRRASLLKLTYEKSFSMLANTMLDPLLTYQSGYLGKKGIITGHTNSLSMADLDLDAILKAAQSISTEIDLPRLLRNLSEIILKNTGAESGALIIHNNNHWIVKAMGTENNIKLLDDIEVNLIEENKLPLAQHVIETVIRTGKQELLSNACEESAFVNDRHIKEEEIRSILCMPLTRQNDLIGIIYLENKAIKNAFSESHQHVLNLLSSQATVSIENSLLYDNTKRLNIAYERFVPKEFLSLLKKQSILDIKVGDQIQQNMTVLFADIKDFTKRSEKMSPADNFKFINDFLHEMEPLIRAHHGFIDKYIGDAIMALFPSAEEALACAIKMLNKLHVLNTRYTDNPVHISIGLNTGPLILGIVGGEERLEGTVISDTVNLAARIEVLNKLYVSDCLITANTLHALPEDHPFKLRFLGSPTVRGKSDKIAVYEVLDHYPVEVYKHKLATRDQFEQAIEYYEHGKFLEANNLFKLILQQDPQDTTAHAYLQLCGERLKVSRYDASPT